MVRSAPTGNEDFMLRLRDSKRRLWGLVACCGLIACGSSATPAESPADETQTSVEAPSGEPTGEEKPAADATEESKGAAKDSAPSTAEDLKTVLQLVLDDETL